MDGLSGMVSSAVQLQQDKTNMEIQMGVLKKSLQVEKEVGEMLVGLIEQAGSGTAKTPGKAIGLGSNFDVTG
jgi:Tfp pilus assembly protein PilO